MFNQEVEKSEQLNKILGVGIGAFQGLSNLALNGKRNSFFVLCVKKTCQTILLVKRQHLLEYWRTTCL